MAEVAYALKDILLRTRATPAPSTSGMLEHI
jgi:hypothetical protein